MKKINCHRCGAEKVMNAKCEGCGHMPKQNKKFGQVVLIVIVAAIGIMFLINISTPSDQPKYEAKWYKEYSKSDVFILAKGEVKKQLKSPSTADFPPSAASTIIRQDSVTYHIESYVDSQNGFGAMIRTKFSCEVKLVNRKQYRVNDIRFY